MSKGRWNQSYLRGCAPPSSSCVCVCGRPCSCAHCSLACLGVGGVVVEPSAANLLSTPGSRGALCVFACVCVRARAGMLRRWVWVGVKKNKNNKEKKKPTSLGIKKVNKKTGDSEIRLMRKKRLSQGSGHTHTHTHTHTLRTEGNDMLSH